jgi:serine/threonine-protein kinase
MTIEPGTIIEGRYRVERRLGEGGMGAVYAVRDPGGGELALKVALDASDPVMRRRFVREAEAAGALLSEHAARVFASGVLEDGAPYMVMELLSGQDLHDYLVANGRLSPDVAVDVVLQVCDALAEAHDLGLVHRDVKPANIFVREGADGRLMAKLIDFGVSKTALAEAPPVTQLTQTGTLLGSPHYMSPEQLVSSHDVDARADIWSVGATLYECLAGVAPFAHDTVAEVVSAVLRDPPPPIREKRPDVPAALERTVMRCLDKDAEQRFASVSELIRALSKSTRTARREQARPAPREAPKATSPADTPPRRWWWAIAAVAVLGIGVTLWAVMGSGDEGDTFAPGTELVGSDLELSESERDAMAKQVQMALGKLHADKYATAERLAADVEEAVVAAGAVHGENRSRLAQDAAIIRARAHAELALAAVKRAGRGDDPPTVVNEVKRHLEQEERHARRAADWDPEAPRCIRSAPAFTHMAVLDAWQSYMKRIEDASKLAVAKNYESALERDIRAGLERARSPSSGLSDACRERVEDARAKLAP